MGGLPIPSGAGKGAGGLGIAGIIIFILIQVLGGGGSGGGFNIPGGLPSGARAQDPQPGQGIPAGQDPQADLKDFTTYVFTDVQQMWKQTFEQAGQPYAKAQAVLYSGGVSTGCGNATSAVGPFYCPADSRVYLDLSFYNDMEQQLGAPGDFAWAYVIAHEMGHHVQNLEGTSDKV